MIAGGNHTSIHRLWRAAAPAGAFRSATGQSPALSAEMSATLSASPMPASFGTFLAGQEKYIAAPMLFTERYTFSP